MQIDYSFIIPHKNTPDLLQKCLDSIPRRGNVQIIVVDDNSDSEVVDFSHFPGLDDATVEVYLTKEGKGAGYARNVGLKHAVGKWLVFADADDFFTEDMISALDEYADADYDVVFFKGSCIRIPDGSPGHRGELMNEAVDRAIATGDYSDVSLLTAPVRRFIRHSLVVENKICFRETRWANDVVFIAKVISCSYRFAASSLSIYCITESSGSLVYCRSLESQVTRFKEEGKGVRIFRRKFPASRMSYWYFFTWMGVYKINKAKAISLLPLAVFNNGFSFIREAVKAKFS